MTLGVGQRFADRFTLLGELGEGGMGRIYEVADTKFAGMRRALKVLLPSKQRDAKARELFSKEVTATASIKSDHVVQVIDYDVEAAEPWMLLELLEGETLDAHVRATGPLPWEEARRRAMELGHALGAAHAAGVLHLDLKPSNLYLAHMADAYGTTKLKVLDFGLSRQIVEGKSHVLQSRAMGTEAWMPPEQFNRKSELRPSADVWPLGLIAFWMLTAKHYWLSIDDHGEAEDFAHLLGEVTAGATTSASARAKERNSDRSLPEGFDAWFAKCVARDVSARWPDGGTASRELDGVLSRASVISAPPVSPPPKPAYDATREAPRPLPPAGLTAPVQVVMPQPVFAPQVQRTVAVETPTTAPVVAPARSSGARIGAGVVGLLGVVALAAWGLQRSQRTQPTQSPDAGALVVPPQAPPPPPPPPPTCPSDMVLIPAGEFLMGSPDGQGDSDEHPQHRVRFAQPFCMERTEVSVASYRACVAAGACEPAPVTVDWPGISAADRRYSRFCNGEQADRLDHPMNCVNWSQSKRYCEWSGHESGARRLPREAEWEYAARGSANRTYPWGEAAPDGTRTNLCGDECRRLLRSTMGGDFTVISGWHDDYGATAPVTAFSAGATPEGLLNMAGNVWEWVDDVYASDAYLHHDAEGFYARDASVPSQSTESRVFRGGGWYSDYASVARAAVRYRYAPTDRDYGVLGFRCARGVR